MSDEDPIRNSCLQPQSLILTKSECFYCFAPEGIKCFTIWDNFGIKTCDLHYPLSIRDCNAYMHMEGYVILSDLHQSAEFMLTEFPVKRSSGLIQDGWTLDLGSNWSPQIMKHDRVANDWIIPIIYKDGNLCRRLHSKELITQEILHKMPINFEGNLAKFILLLYNGIYKKDYDLYTSLVDNSKPTNTFGDDYLLGINMCIDSSGQFARILNLPSST